MCRFIETIRVENGRVRALDYHQNRVNETLLRAGECGAVLNLDFVLSGLLDCRASELQHGIFKVRIIYDEMGRVFEAVVLPYNMRTIENLILVRCDDIDYRFKYADRSRLDALKVGIGRADEIIIVKDGLLTDTSYSNIALYDGERWFTPRCPLLRGTMRQQLLDSGEIEEVDITPEDMGKFEKVCLINAMMPLGRCSIGINDIRF